MLPHLHSPDRSQLPSQTGASYPPPHPGTAGKKKSGNNSPALQLSPCETRGKSNTWLSHSIRNNSLIIGSLKYLKIIG